jgi:hypothetical protein
MQTFLPYPDFKESAKVLDYKRLGKQRVECKQILKALYDSYDKAWKNHVVTRMWRGYESALALYGLDICNEWISRGYKDNTRGFFIACLTDVKGPPETPKWFGDIRIHNSHKSKLLQKDFEFYSQWNWDVPIDLPYFWPENI